jgi:hypothetical protein
VLGLDEASVVFHDGSSADRDGENLHFLDLRTEEHIGRRAPELMREFDVVRDGSIFFVLTHDPGVSDTGARLFRVDARATTVLRYALPPAGVAYAPPLLTRRYVVLAVAAPRSAHVRLYDREASAATSGPQLAFLIGDTASADFDATPRERSTPGVPPAVVAAGDGLYVSDPCGLRRMEPRDTR